ncbi:MAG: hypothetical protein K0S00_3233 [Xanthobacteraceae bacterium]|jgi:hypothetical protein|nr:hypothetical protein [Xanthobacteraceae bacterium]
MRICRSLLILAGFWIWADAASAQPYTDPTIGFSIVKPSDWFFIDEGEIERSLQMQKLDNEALEALIKKSADKPLVALSKFREPYDDANPSVIINVQPAGPFKGAAPAHIAKAMTAVMTKLLRDVRLEECSEDTSLSGLPAAYCQFTYIFVTSAGDFPSRTRLWIVRRQEHLFIITGSARQDERNGTLAEVNAVIRNITIDLRS